MNLYTANQTRNLKSTGLALLVASAIILTEGCATNQNNTRYSSMPNASIVYNQQKSPQPKIYSEFQPKKERNKILKFFDDFFSTGAFSLFAGF